MLCFPPAGGNLAEYYYADHQGVPVIYRAKTEITAANLNLGTGTVECVRMYARSLDDERKDCDAGHILAKRLGGSGDQPLNIFSQVSLSCVCIEIRSSINNKILKSIIEPGN